MKTIVTAAGILTVCVVVGAADTVRATPEPSTNESAVTVRPVVSRDAGVVLPLLARFGKGSGLDYIRSVLGEPDLDVGSASPHYIYRLLDGSTIQIRFSMKSKTVLSIIRQGAGVSPEQVIYGDTVAPANLLPADPAALIATMTSTSATWEARCRAEDALTNCVPKEVLTSLLPHTGANRPSGMIWNSAGRDSERGMPADWQLMYAVQRAWEAQARRLTDAEHKTFWLELLAKAGMSGAKVTLIRELTEHWTPQAEPTLRQLIEDAGRELPVRVAAGRCLALHAARSAHNSLVSLLAGAGSFAEREQWFDIVSDPRHKQETGEDPQVVRLGFAFLAEERARSSNYVHGGYFIVIKLGNYVGAENQFQPEMTSRYRGSNGLTEAFFSDTVNNAERWWTKNRDRIKRVENAAAPIGQ